MAGGSADERYPPSSSACLRCARAKEAAPHTKGWIRAVNGDPLCQEPRRFCGFFRGKLEETERHRMARRLDHHRSGVLAITASGLFAAFPVRTKKEPPRNH